MKWRNLFGGALFAGIFAASCAALAPASLLGWGMGHASGGALFLADPRGTVWNGSGVLVLQNDASIISLGAYEWHARLADLLAAELTFAVRREESERPMLASFAPLRNEVRLTGLQLTLPVQVLEMASPQLRPYQFSGEIDLQGDELKLSARGIEGKVAMRWERAGSGLSDIYPLGTYLLDMAGTGKTLNVRLSTESGSLLLAGQGQLEQGRGLTFNGTAQAGPGGQLEQLTEMLHHIGPETSPGVFALTLLPQASGG
ncbi:MAG TPA: type II secretion system protein N [Sideroxyarcus sp.]|nr:type II secretion system protein N [Sideroxyarcus sp.]